MNKRAVCPPAFQAAAKAMNASPAILSCNHLFLTGMTGSRADGSMPGDPHEQFRNAFEKINAILAEENLNFSAVVEMTSYHVALHQHFDVFSAVRSEYVQVPSPAWTAVEVAGLRRKGALVEIRVIADARC
ncbi:RidA family protein [Roseibium sp.]|uniref:RidA family protein n=1 Tax=Roseibium sp. TaxID=1936156 RepID=UPI003B520B70